MNNIYDIDGAAEFGGVAGHVLRHFIRRGLLKAETFAGGRYILREAVLTEFLARYRAGEWDGRRNELRRLKGRSK
jgi:predicted site-specific integrase-resolvase